MCYKFCEKMQQKRLKQTDMTKFARNEHNEVKVICPVWAVPKRVKVFSSTRIGGVSQPPFDSLNLGAYVKDNQQHVVENRARAVTAIQAPNQPLWLNQVHGRDVAFIDCYYNGDNVPQADGTFTREAGRVLCVGTADCLPVVLSNSQGDAVSVVHAGWRGLADGVLQSAIAHFNETDQLHAWLGPAIGPDAFEVGTDVVDLFLSRHKDYAAGFKPVGNGKFMADIYALARMTLTRHRPVVISGGEHCTYSQADLFHSHRRDGVASGRMATFVWIE